MSKIVIRDFDWPIIDSRKVWFDHMRLHFLETYGKYLSDDDIEQLYTGNIFDKYKQITNTEITQEIILWYNQNYEDHIADMSMVPWIDTIIRLFNELGYIQYIVSSNTADLDTILEWFWIRYCFEDILDGNKERSKVKKFEYIKEKNVNNAELIFITDTTWDAYEAHEVGITNICGVTRWYHSGRLLLWVPWLKILNNVTDFYTEFPELTPEYN